MHIRHLLAIFKGLCIKLTTEVGGRMLSVTPGSWTCCPQTHRGGVHCRWPATQVDGGISPSASLWTCTVAGESAGNSVPFFHIHFFFCSLLTLHPNRRFLAGKGTFNRRFLAGKGTENGRLLAGKGAFKDTVYLISFGYSGSYAKIFS